MNNNYLRPNTFNCPKCMTLNTQDDITCWKCDRLLPTVNIQKLKPYEINNLRKRGIIR